MVPHTIALPNELVIRNYQKSFGYILETRSGKCNIQRVGIEPTKFALKASDVPNHHTEITQSLLVFLQKLKLNHHLQ